LPRYAFIFPLLLLLSNHFEVILALRDRDDAVLELLIRFLSK
jgi:hypothetical protein